MKPVIIALAGFLGGLLHAQRPMPDFAGMVSPLRKKETFVAWLVPHVSAVNSRIAKDRRRLLGIVQTPEDSERGRRAMAANRDWLLDRCDDYGILVDPRMLDPTRPFARRELHGLVKRMDVIPPSLAIAQAAIESGWGTSRFARQGNNLFGMRTYTPGTGIVPGRRARGETWEIARYDSPTESVDAYVMNLNVHGAYRSLRQIRAERRARGEPLTGEALADGLSRYSERGVAYVESVKSIIGHNRLDRHE